MATTLGSILRNATRKDGEPLNILTFPTHEPYESMLCKTKHNFYAVRTPQVRDWNHKCRLLPDNYILLDRRLSVESQLPPDVDFDIVLSNNRFGQFQLASKLSKHLHLPHVNVEHTLPHPNWGSRMMQELLKMKAHINIFISEYNREQWGWKDDEALVIHHGIDTDLFSPNENVKKENRIISCVNDWINRDWCCGYSIWSRVANGLNTKVLGNTPGLSKGTSTVQELIKELRASSIYLNTSTYSPVPTSMLEAMSCGCVVVSTATCMLPEIVEHGVNGFITNNEKHLREYLMHLLDNPEQSRQMGLAARQTVLNMFSKDRFVKKWDDALRYAAETVVY